MLHRNNPKGGAHAAVFGLGFLKGATDLSRALLPAQFFALTPV
jgi:hypothetical protein